VTDRSPPLATPLHPAVRRALRAGRAHLAAGDRAAAVAAFHAAVMADPRAALRDWGLVAVLQAEGRANLRLRLRDRLHRWRALPPDHPCVTVAGLTTKPGLRAFATRHGFALAPLLAMAPRLADLPQDLLAQDAIVVKPTGDSSNRGVAVMVGGIDRMTGAPTGPDPALYLARRYAQDGLTETPVLVEAALRDADPDPALIIPRDIKVFAVAGRAVMVRVHDRNAPEGRRGLITRDRLGAVLPASQIGWPAAPPGTPPPGWAALVAEAERQSALLPLFLRLDFYLTPAGPVLGEVTTHPNAGQNYTRFGRRTALQMWEIHPDPV
jgi:hypothetical protein